VSPETGHEVHEVSALQAAELVQAGAMLLDVREADEWQAGHAPVAVHLPMSTISGRAGELPTDRQIICVCHLGQRSAMVADALRRAGWDAVNLSGGMESWAAAGLPVVDHLGRNGSIP
jgi:rhodanese-related sulfurtransferase